MRTKAVLAVVLAVAALGVVQLGVAAPAQAVTGNIGVHDPSVMKVGNCYYAFSTGPVGDAGNPSGAITERRTCAGDPGSGWTYLGAIWNSTPSWIVDRIGRNPPDLWAPDINYFNNRYHLYYAASVSANGVYAVLGLATATNIEGPWTDQGMVTDVNYPIDPEIITANGTMYIVWGSWPGTYMHVLDPATGKLSTSNNTLWRLATGIEGQTIIYNGGYYYLFGSKGSCCQGTASTYYTAVGRSTSPTGPYTDQSGANMTSGAGTVMMRGAWPKVGAGGGDAYTDGSGTFLAYHYYDGNDSGHSKLDIRQVTFANGWPILAAPLGSPNYHLLNNNSNLCADVWQFSTADNAAVNQGTCSAGTNQQWVLTPVGSRYELVNVNSHKCLGISGSSTAAGAAAVQVPCTGAASHLWTRTPTVGGYVTFANANSGQCLEVAAFSTTSGTAMSQYTCNGGSNQQWLPV